MLCRFNIWNTAPDINFDRIAHLVKLVFNTKFVLISLLDGTEQYALSIILIDVADWLTDGSNLNVCINAFIVAFKQGIIFH